MKLWCVECSRTVETVDHGTPPTYSDHHYIDLDALCGSLGHLRLNATGPQCVRCGEATR